MPYSIKPILASALALLGITVLTSQDARAQTNYGVDIWTGPNLVTLATNLFQSPGTPAGEGYKVWFVADLNGDGLATNALRTGLIGGDNYLLKEGFINDGNTSDGVGNYFDFATVSKQFTNANIYVYIWNTTSATEAGGDQFGVLSLGTNQPPLFGNATWLINSAVTANQFAVLGFATNVWNFNNSDNWSVGANWVGGVAPVSSSTNLVSFGGTANYDSTNNLGAFILNVLEFTNSAGTVSLHGGALVFTNQFGFPEIGHLGAGNAIISNVIDLEANLNIVGNGSGTLTLAGDLTGTGDVTKTGTHTLLLAGPNTFSGLFTMAGGTLLVGDNGAFGANTLRLNSGTIASANSSTRQLANQLVIAGNPIFGQSSGGTGELDFQGGINLGNVNSRVLTVNNPLTRFTGVVSNGGFTKQGTGTLVLESANTLAGGITLAAGALLVGDTAALGTGNVNINGGTLASSDATAYTLTNSMVVGGNFTLGQSSGGTGVLTLGSNLNFGFSSRTITVDNSQGIISGNIQNGQLVKSGTGTLLLSGNNTFDIGVVLNAGTLLIGSATALDTEAMTINGGTIASSDGTARAIANDVTVNADFIMGQSVGGTGALNFGGVFSLGGGIRQITVANATDTISGVVDNGGIIKLGSGTLILSGANSFVDGLAIDAGIVSISDDTNLGDVNSPVTINGTTLRATGNVSMAPERLVTVTASGATVEVTSINTMTQGGVWDGTGNLTKTGAGLLVLSNFNTAFTGKITVNNGTLSVSNTMGLGATPGVAVADQLTLNGGALRWTQTGTNAATRGILLGASHGTIEVNSGVNFTNESVISGAGNLIKDGAGTLSLRPGAATGNIYTGKTVVRGGQLNVTNQNAFGPAPGAFTADLITVSNDAMLVAAGNVDLGVNRGLTIGAGGGRLSVAGNTTLTNYVVTGGASDRLISTNSGTNLFLVGNAGTLNSPVLIHAGIVRVGADNALGTGTIYFTNGNNSRLANNNAATPVTLANAIRFDTNVVLGQGSTAPLTLSGTATLAGGQDRILTVDSLVTNSGGDAVAGERRPDQGGRQHTGVDGGQHLYRADVRDQRHLAGEWGERLAGDAEHLRRSYPHL